MCVCVWANGCMSEKVCWCVWPGGSGSLHLGVVHTSFSLWHGAGYCWLWVMVGLRTASTVDHSAWAGLAAQFGGDKDSQDSQEAKEKESFIYCSSTLDTAVPSRLVLNAFYKMSKRNKLMLDFRCTWMAPKTGGEPVEPSKFPAMECQLCHVGKKKKKRGGGEGGCTEKDPPICKARGVILLLLSPMHPAVIQNSMIEKLFHSWQSSTPQD